MKINDLQINGFGKLSDKEISLDKNINIIYGKNEAGKSTLLNFISSIFYGTSKNKNGREFSNYDKFLPWKTEEFSGKIAYELDNGEKYEVFRDFKKKNPVIYNENKQDISLNYPIDKTKGIDFIASQIGIDEETFKNTIIVAQNNIKINKQSQNGMIQKISNIVQAGDENISFQKTLDKINKMQTEEVGTDRTRERPFNQVTDRIEELKNAKGKLETYKSFLEENDAETQAIQDKIDDEEIRLALYRVLKESNEERKIKNSEIDVIKNIRDEYFNKIEELDEKVDKNAKEKIKSEKKSMILPVLLILLFVISSIVCFILGLSKAIPISLLGVAGLVLVVDIIKRIKFGKSKKARLKELEELEKKIEQEINVLRGNIKSRQVEIDMKQDEIRQAENEINRLVMNKFEQDLDADFIEEAFEMGQDDLDNKTAEINEKINTLKIKKGAKQNQKEAMQEELNGISRVQEELDRLEEEKKDLISLNNSYNLAKEGLQSAYETIRNSLSPEFTNKLSDIASKVSNGKYKEISFVDTDGLIVEVEDGRFLPVERLSQGTVDQMYLGLRLASIDTIIKEKMPIILDETFAFFDDERLKNILEFINENYKDKQIIIFTCSNREIEALNQLNIEYHYIDLEK
ncbi:MAG: AAA family ATPase [Clostridia bacterium]|nr:AAA family ATPase [Clostridia bacterium]